jgi:GTP cyclohydrolase II
MHNTDKTSKIEPVVSASLPTKWGDFNILAFGNELDELQPHLVLVHKNIDKNAPIYLRIHSECITGDLFGSKRCDCGEQLDHAMKLIAKEQGILIYLRQEGRGIGIVNKLKAYNLQDDGLGTFEANTHLGFEPDERNFRIGVEILQFIGVKKINLITNNPDKMSVFDDTDVTVVDRIPIIIPAKAENSVYLRDKKDKMGHLL